MKVPPQRFLLKEKETRKAFRYYLWISLNILRDALKLNGEKEAEIILKFFLRRRFDEESSLFSLPAILTSPCLFALRNIFLSYLLWDSKLFLLKKMKIFSSKFNGTDHRNFWNVKYVLRILSKSRRFTIARFWKDGREIYRSVQGSRADSYINTN